MTQTEIYQYLQPIVSGCSGFLKSEGYMVVQCDHLILMSFDQAFLSLIKINPLNMIYIAKTKDFIGCKNDPEHFVENTKFYGNMAVYYDIVEKAKVYQNIDQQLSPIFVEDDLYNIDGFQDNVSNTPISWTVFNDGTCQYKMPVSKSITPLNKGDTCSLRIYDMYHDNTRIFNYIIHKSKLKLDVYMYTRQYVF